MFDALAAVDVTLMGWMRALHAPWLDVTMAWISAGGRAGIVWLAVASIAFVRRPDRAAAWRVLLGVALSYAVVDGVLKPVVNRERPASIASSESAPPRPLPPLPATTSFPSGHATSSFSAAVIVSRMWPRAAVAWWGLAALVGYSRVYLGHHYPLDVIGGALLGVAIGWWVLGGRDPRPLAASPPRPVQARR